jgi:DNA-binding LacI/PurR family transcriptional regulator
VPDDLAEALKTRRLAGLLFAGESNPAALKWLLKQKVPLVALSYAPVAPYRVRLDHSQTAHLGTSELARRGCKHIALWIPVGVGIGPEAGRDDFEELAAFKSALAEHGLKFDPSLVWRGSDLSAGVPATPEASNFEQGAEAARGVFEGKTPKPDGILVLDDLMARGALSVFQEQGLRPGQDFQLATHTNRGSQLLLGFEDIIRLEFDPHQIAVAMIDLLDTLIAGETPENPVISIPPSIT